MERFTATFKLEKGEVPHEFVAATETVPLVKFAVVEIVLFEDEPVHPLGNNQV